VRYRTEKIGGKSLSINQLKALNDCLDNYGLSEIRNMGGKLTWNNKNIGAAGSQVDWTELLSMLSGQILYQTLGLDCI